jgi:hypothetical protein
VGVWIDWWVNAARGEQCHFGWDRALPPMEQRLSLRLVWHQETLLMGQGLAI